MFKSPSCLGTHYLEADATSHLQISLRVPAPRSSLSSAQCALKVSAMSFIGNLYGQKG